MNVHLSRRMSLTSGRLRMAAGIAAVGLILVSLTACGGSSRYSGTPAAAAIPKVGQVAGYTATNANEEGYWYSRYNMMSLTMQSGLGETFMPSATDMQMAMQMAAQNPADPAMPPVNAALISAVYAGGDPHYVTSINPMDFGTLRWKGGPARMTTEATAWTIIKEIEWAKLFHVDAHFGTPTDSFGATQRFAGMMFAPMVKMQNMALQQNPGRFEQSVAGDFALLTAYSNASAFFGAATMPHSATNRYADPAASTSFAALAKRQFVKVIVEDPADVRERSLGIQSVVWYASITSDPLEKAFARAAIIHWADNITIDPSSTPVVKAYAIRGLIEAGRVTGAAKYLDQAATVYASLVAGFDTTHGVLSGTTRLTTDDIGVIGGALNASGIFLGTRIDQAALKTLFGIWWEGTVNLSGFQIAAPALAEFKGAYETQQDPINLRYPLLPLPKDAGATYGSAPVFAASVSWTTQGWTADRNWFDTAGAMHASTEFVWFHNDEVNGFPDVILP